jgi:hypothetical protein
MHTYTPSIFEDRLTYYFSIYHITLLYMQGHRDSAYIYITITFGFLLFFAFFMLI